MSSDQKIADLKRQLGETVQRIDSIQQGRQLPLTSRIAQHFRTQSGSLINVVLTASVLAVALGKMQQKQQFQGEKLEWEEQRERIQRDNQRLSSQVSGLQQQLDTLHSNVQQELDGGGFRLGPVKSRLQQLLADFAVRPSVSEDLLPSMHHDIQHLEKDHAADGPMLDPSDQLGANNIEYELYRPDFRQLSEVVFEANRYCFTSTAVWAAHNAAPTFRLQMPLTKKLICIS